MHQNTLQNNVCENFHKTNTSNKDIQELYIEIGNYLYQTRINQNYTLEQISNHLKIRKHFLNCIEIGKFDQLPQKKYINWFIKSYAKFLKINLDDYLEKLPSSIEPLYKNSSPIFSGNFTPKNNFNKTYLFISFILTIVIITGIFFFLNTNDKINKYSNLIESQKLNLQNKLNDKIPDIPALPSPPEIFSDIILEAQQEIDIDIIDENEQILTSRQLKSGERFRVLEQEGLKLIVHNIKGINIFLNDKEVILSSFIDENNSQMIIPLNIKDLKSFLKK